ncbi:MAG TPA: hypothetical protein VGH29_01360 [Candidatus Binataceae bacterium]
MARLGIKRLNFQPDRVARGAGRAKKAVAPNPQSSEVESIAAQLRASIRKAGAPRSHPAPVPVAAAQPETQIDFDLQLLRSTYDVTSAPFTSHRRLLGPFIIAIKNFARELLLQLLVRQSVHNGAAARSITHLNQRLNLLAQEHARMAQRLAELEARLEAVQPSSAPWQPRSGQGRFEDGAEPRADAAQDAIEGRRQHPRERP